MKLWDLISLEESKTILKKYFKIIIKSQLIGLDESLGMVISKDIKASHPLPDFRKSTLDGYAVRAKDTYGSSSTIPVVLDLVENIEIGKKPKKEINPGQASYVPTGGMLPKGADAVVMIEYSHLLGDKVALEKPVSPLEGVIDIGEDIKEGQTILKASHRINSASYGMLKAQGKEELEVYKPLDLVIVSTGDELVRPEDQPSKGQVRDINSHSLYALAKKLNMNVLGKEIIKDNKEEFKNIIDKYIDKADLIVFSGGSSKGEGDYTLETFKEYGQVLFHGISIQPGKPTLASFNKENKTILIGLPGHPMAAILVWELLVAESIKEVTGQIDIYKIKARLSTNIAGASGRDKIVPAYIDPDDSDLIHPIHGSSATISTLAMADGFIFIPKMSEGLYKDQEIEINLFRGGRL